MVKNESESAVFADFVGMTLTRGFSGLNPIETMRF